MPALATPVNSGSMLAVDELLSPTVTTFTTTLGIEVGLCDNGNRLVAAWSEVCELVNVASANGCYCTEQVLKYLKGRSEYRGCSAQAA